MATFLLNCAATNIEMAKQCLRLGTDSGIRLAAFHTTQAIECLAKQALCNNNVVCDGHVPVYKLALIVNSLCADVSEETKRVLNENGSMLEDWESKIRYREDLVVTKDDVFPLLEFAEAMYQEVREATDVV